MQKIAPDYSFLENLQKIANNPNLMVGRFKKIDPAEVTTYPVTPLAKVFAIASAFFGALSIVYPKSFEVGFSCAFSIIGFGLSIYIAKETKRVSEYTQQIKEVDELLDPCLDGMRRAVFAKAQYIYNEVNGKRVERKEGAVKELMDQAAKAYDESSPEAKSIRAIAAEFRQLRIDETSVRVSEYAQEKFKNLVRRMEAYVTGAYGENWRDDRPFFGYSGYNEERSAEGTESFHVSIEDPFGQSSWLWNKLR